MKNNGWLFTVLTAAITAVIASVACTVATHLLWLSPEWRASGDGKTIFSEKTGELRYTVSGRSVAEFQAEAAKEQIERERKVTKETERWRNEAEQKRLANERKREASRRHKSQLFQEVKLFVDANPTVEGVTFNWKWAEVTKPFRTSKLLSRREHAELLDFLGLAVQKEPYKSDPDFSKAIEALKAWDLSYSN
jgi:hypothetical protein